MVDAQGPAAQFWSILASLKGEVQLFASRPITGGSESFSQGIASYRL